MKKASAIATRSAMGPSTAPAIHALLLADALAVAGTAVEMAAVAEAIPVLLDELGDMVTVWGTIEPASFVLSLLVSVQHIDVSDGSRQQ